MLKQDLTVVKGAAELADAPCQWDEPADKQHLWAQVVQEPCINFVI